MEWRLAAHLLLLPMGSSAGGIVLAEGAHICSFHSCTKACRKHLLRTICCVHSIGGCCIHSSTSCALRLLPMLLWPTL